MSNVQAGEKIFTVDDYEDSPTKFAALLEAAKINPGYATCLCVPSRPHLVIRRITSKDGDRFFLATWPNTGTSHAPECRFHHSEDDYEQGRAKRLGAILSAEDGFSIKPDFSLRRSKAVAEQKRPPLDTPSHDKNATQRSTVGLLGILEFIWQSAGLNKWLSTYQPASPQRWTNLVTRVNSVLAQGKMGARRLSDLVYVVPAYNKENQHEINSRLQAMIDVHKSTDTIIPAFLLIGEVSQVAAAGKALQVKICHHKEPLWMFPSLARRLAQRYRCAEAILDSHSPQGRVVGLFAVEVTSKGGLWVKDAALMGCSREYIPCDSSHEVQLANMLTQQARTFIKPLRIEDAEDVLPDFKLFDCTKPTVMEIWGMNTPEYNAHRAEKISRYKKAGVSLWQWDAVQYDNPPQLPTRRD